MRAADFDHQDLFASGCSVLHGKPSRARRDNSGSSASRTAVSPTTIASACATPVTLAGAGIISCTSLSGSANSCPATLNVTRGLAFLCRALLLTYVHRGAQLRVALWRAPAVGKCGLQHGFDVEDLRHSLAFCDGKRAEQSFRAVRADLLGTRVELLCARIFQSRHGVDYDGDRGTDVENDRPRARAWRSVRTPEQLAQAGDRQHRTAQVGDPQQCRGSAEPAPRRERGSLPTRPRTAGRRAAR